jgi:Recombinase zinc beta ribbon domain
LRCEVCGAGFVICGNSNRYRCASHVNGGDAACSMSITVPRERVERIILNFAERELPGMLDAAEARYAQPHAMVDHRPRIAELEKQVANFVKMIGAGDYSPAVSATLKAAETELTQLKAAMAAQPRPAHKASREPIERRVKRMREQLAKGGEIAQSVLRELFPIGFKLSPDPNGGRYLWASTQTALPADWLSKRDADGQLPGEYWPRVYFVTTCETPDAKTPVISASYQVENSMVAGGRFVNFRLSLAA